MGRKLIYLDEAIDVAKQHWYKPDIAKALEELPSAQPDLSDDGTLMMTVPNGMLNDVKRVLVDEVGTKNCKTMYQDQPERKKGHWIKVSPANIYECSECGKNVMTDDISAYDFCHGCGAEMRGENNG